VVPPLGEIVARQVGRHHVLDGHVVLHTGNRKFVSGKAAWRTAAVMFEMKVACCLLASLCIKVKYSAILSSIKTYQVYI